MDNGKYLLSFVINIIQIVSPIQCYTVLSQNNISRHMGGKFYSEKEHNSNTSNNLIRENVSVTQ